MSRRVMEFPLEQTVKIGQIVEADCGGDLQNAVITCAKKPCCDGQPVIIQIFDESHTHM